MDAWPNQRCPRAHGAGDLPDLLDHPPEHAVGSPGGVPLEVGPAHDVLELADQHAGESTRRQRPGCGSKSLDPGVQEALKLAQENWLVQKEPADIGILLEAALAANDAAAVAVVKDWLGNCGLQDVHLSQLMAGKHQG